MNSDKFEARMRALESYHSIKVPSNTWLVIRVDGRSFSKLTETMKFEKPFDSAFSGYMINVAKALVEEFQATYAFTESDEISLLLPPTWSLFDRELEKVVSVSAAAAAGKMTHLLVHAVRGEIVVPPIMFDSRVCICPNEAAVTDYFRWRQGDANRCAINGYCYWTLRKEGLSAHKASSILNKKSQDEKLALLKEKGIVWDEVPGWQKNGTGLYWTKFSKTGLNPKTGQTVEVMRRGIKIEHGLPVKNDYDLFLTDLMNADDISVPKV
jgi:tRNA(His) guanylyltransferase